MVNQDFQALVITLKLAFITTVILLVVCTPLAWWLARTNSKLRSFIETVVALPLVLPPTVIGFYLLIFLGKNGPLTNLLKVFGLNTLAFTFTGLVIGSIFYSLPFVVKPLQDAFTAIEERYLEVATTLGATPFDRFISIAIPLSKNGFFTAAILGFAHTIGEFGVVLMIGGNIPNKTQVLSIAIYDHVESMQYTHAHTLSAGLLLLSFLLLFGLNTLNSSRQVKSP